MALRIWMALFLAFAAYITCVATGYVWDDHLLILQNDALSAPTWRKLLASDLWCCTQELRGSGYWRPLTTLSLFADVASFGYAPGPAHFQSLCWHLLCTGLLGKLVEGRHGGARGAVAALVFGLHPALSEAVIWISARNDLLAATFCVGALLAADARRPVLAGVCALAGALSKESSFLLPGMIGLWAYGHGGAAGVRDARRALVGSAVGLAVALALRPFVDLGAQALPRLEITDPYALVYGLVRIFGWLSWPWPLTGTATLYMGSPSAGTWLAAAVTLAGAALLVRVEVRRGLALAGLAALAALPVAGALYVYATLGERYLYLPMVGVAALIASAVPLNRASGVGLAVGSVGALAAIHVRLPDWSNNAAFFSAATRRAPDSFTWNLLGVDLGRDGQRGPALAAFESALLPTPDGDPPQTFACRNVLVAARAVMDAPTLAARLPAWKAAGCYALPPFEPSAAWSLALLGDEAAGLQIAHGVTASDTTGLLAVLFAVEAERDGDIVRAAGLLAGAKDVSDARDRYGTLLALRD